MDNMWLTKSSMDYTEGILGFRECTIVGNEVKYHSNINITV